MRLWKRASGALKDQNSILLASLARRSAFRNPEIEGAVIKATRHDEYPIDQRYVERLYAWIRVSPNHLKPVAWAITMRVEKTRSWEVALKGLMLIHRVLCFNIAPVHVIGRLPFDLSAFTDRHSNPEKTWPQNAFVRSYFAFLDRKSILLFEENNHRTNSNNHLSSFSVTQDLNVLRNLQGLLDILLQVRPHPEVAGAPLVLQAMDMIVVEVYDIYRRICNGIARVLLRIYMAGKTDAKTALQIVQKATLQGEALTVYFDSCAELGLITFFDCPKVKRIPEEDIRELEDIIKGPPPSSKGTRVAQPQAQKNETTVPENGLKTVITDNWEIFDEDHHQMVCAANNVHQDLPDLISFTNLLSV